ncbi:unnamed protein product, partial [Penicillium nalgiovense]
EASADQEASRTIGISSEMSIQTTNTILSSYSWSSSSSIRCRRTEAIDAVAAYCQFEEGITCRLPQNKRVESHVAESGYVDDQKPESETTEVQTKSASPLENAIRSVTKDNRPLFCFICVGQQNLALKKRVQLFSSHGDVSKHIKRKHLQNLGSSTVIACNVCDKKFAEVMHFQRHANDSHSTVTGPLWRAGSKQ